MSCIVLKGADSEVTRFVFGQKFIDIDEHVVDKDKVIFTVTGKGYEHIHEINFRNIDDTSTAEEYCAKMRDIILRALVEDKPVVVLI